MAAPPPASLCCDSDLVALQPALDWPDRNVHRMVGRAHKSHGSLTELPWAALVMVLVAWQPPRRGRERG